MIINANGTPSISREVTAGSGTTNKEPNFYTV